MPGGDKEGVVNFATEEHQEQRVRSIKIRIGSIPEIYCAWMNLKETTTKRGQLRETTSGRRREGRQKPTRQEKKKREKGPAVGYG